MNEKGEDIYTIAFHICSMTVPDIDIDVSIPSIITISCLLRAAVC